MSPNRHQKHSLRIIEAGLYRSDPELAPPQRAARSAAVAARTDPPVSDHPNLMETQ